MEDDRVFLSAKDVAVFLDVSVQTVKALVKKGAINAGKLSPGKTARLRFHKEDVREYVERIRKGG